jgi:hypothetical protein
MYKLSAVAVFILLYILSISLVNLFIRTNLLLTAVNNKGGALDIYNN